MHRVGLLAPHHERIERRRVGFRRQMVAVMRRQFHHARPALRHLHDAPNGRHARRAQRHGHHLVGADHEVLNQPRCRIRPPPFHAAHLAVVHHGLQLGAVEGQRTHPVARRAQQVRRFILQLQLRLQLGRRRHLGRHCRVALQPRTHGAVR
jgi:hypothetical protein